MTEAPQQRKMLALGEMGVECTGNLYTNFAALCKSTTYSKINYLSAKRKKTVTLLFKLHFEYEVL